MRISVRSPIMSRRSYTRSLAFLGRLNRPGRGRNCPALPRRHPLRRLSRAPGARFEVPGCGEERIPSEWPSRVTRVGMGLPPYDRERVAQEC